MADERPDAERANKVAGFLQEASGEFFLPLDVRYAMADALLSDAGAEVLPPEVSGETSDGFHTFNELYEFRLLYNAALFNEWAAAGRYGVHKSWRHHDGSECFGGGWFIVMAQLPTGQVSNHYPAEDWPLFAVPERDRAAEWDGHTAADVAVRLRAFLEKDVSGGGA